MSELPAVVAGTRLRSKLRIWPSREAGEGSVGEQSPMMNICRAVPSGTESLSFRESCTKEPGICRLFAVRGTEFADVIAIYAELLNTAGSIPLGRVRAAVLLRTRMVVSRENPMRRYRTALRSRLPGQRRGGSESAASSASGGTSILAAMRSRLLRVRLRSPRSMPPM